MLRQKYSKKKRREKQKKRRKTRKIGGTKNPKRKISKEKRRAAAAMSMHPEVLRDQNRTAMTRLMEDANSKEMERMLSEAGAAPGESEAGASAAADEVPQSCSAKARRHPICRTCGWTKDPGALKKCKCCPNSPQARRALAAEKAAAESAGASKDWEEPAGASAGESYLSDAKINENMRDNLIPNNSEEFPSDDPIRQSIETKPIKCRKGSKKPNCKGNKGVKARKRARQKCTNSGGKVLDRNKRNERCETYAGIQMQPITHDDGDSDNRGTMPQRNPGIAQRAAKLEAAFGSSEHKDPHATEMVTPSCARVVGPNRDIYYAEVNEAGDGYTGEVTRDVDSPMCRPKAAAAGPAAEPTAAESAGESGISQRAANLEAAFGSSEHKDPHATEMVTPRCARVVGPNRDVYYAEVNEAGDGYTGDVTRDVDSPMCRPKAAATEAATEAAATEAAAAAATTAEPASESGSFNDPDYMTSLVSTLPGVDVNDPVLQEAIHGSESDISQPVPSSEVSPGGGESKATSTVGSCRRTTDTDGRSYFYNRAGESAWSGDSPVCHRPMDCFTLNYTLTLNKVF